MDLENTFGRGAEDFPVMVVFVIVLGFAVVFILLFVLSMVGKEWIELELTAALKRFAEAADAVRGLVNGLNKNWEGGIVVVVGAVGRVFKLLILIS